VTVTQNPPTPAWLRRFFAAPNLLLFDELVSRAAQGGWHEDVLPWLRLQLKDDADAPICLPLVRSSGEVVWYGLARTERGRGKLGDELSAFVGPSYSDFAGNLQQLDPRDPNEGSLLAEFGSPVFRFQSVSPQGIEGMRRAMRLYCGLVARRPPLVRPPNQPLGIIRGDFDRALLAGDEVSARRLYEDLLSTGLLNGENQLYLGIRMRAGLGLWQQIAGDAQMLRNLVDLQFPPRVLADVTEALYHTHLEQHESRGDAKNAVEAFRAAGVGRLGRLFGSRRGLTRPAVVKAFLFHAALEPAFPMGRFEELIELLGHQANEPFLVSLSEIVEPQLTHDSHDEVPSVLADNAFDEMDYERALELYSAMPVTPANLSRLAVCAKMLADPSAVARVKEVMATITPAFTERLSAKVRQLLAEILTDEEHFEPSVTAEGSVHLGIDAAPPLLGGWLEWARWVASGVPVAMVERALAEQAIRWDVEEYVQDPVAADELSDLLGNIATMPMANTGILFPELFRAFLAEHEHPSPALKSVYTILLTMIVLAEAVSEGDLELGTQLVEALVSIGLSDSDYRTLTKDLLELMDRQSAVSTLPWALDIAEILAVYPSPDPEARLRVAVAVLQSARSYGHRLDSGHIHLLRALCRDYDTAFPEDLAEMPAAATQQVDRLSGRHVGIYTLTDQAGSRVAALLTELFPSVRVDVNNDHVCTPRLAALAKNADVFVFASRSSKHQAYYCVKSHRGSDRPLLHPLGKGSASILRAVLG
jgi:hypothetical protein